MLSGGSAKTLMFVHVSPEADTLGEAISTLKFAERVGSVELGAARVNKDNSEVKELKEQVLKPYFDSPAYTNLLYPNPITNLIMFCGDFSDY